MATAAMPAEEFARHRLQPPAMTLLKPYTFIELAGGGEERPARGQRFFWKKSPRLTTGKFSRWRIVFSGAGLT